MLDLRYVRRNPEEAGRRLARRGGELAGYERSLPLWAAARQPTAELEQLRAAHKRMSAQRGRLANLPEDAESRLKLVRDSWEAMVAAAPATRAAIRYFMPILQEEWAPVVQVLGEIHTDLGAEYAKVFREAADALGVAMAPGEYSGGRPGPSIGPYRGTRSPSPDPRIPEPDWETLRGLELGDKLFENLQSSLNMRGAFCSQIAEFVEQAYEKARSELAGQVGEELDPMLWPNFPSDKAPDGADESANQVLEVRDAEGQVVAKDKVDAGWTPTAPGASPHHAEIGERLGGFHPERAAAMSGARFALLSGQLEELHSALGYWMRSLHVREHDYEPWSVPHLLTWEAGEGSGQLPKFGDDIFQVRGTGKGSDGEERPMVLISTSEMALVSVWRDQILAEADLPRRLVALTPCYRREAGAAGRDTRGLIRLHQFEKVELVKLCHPDESGAALEQMRGHAERVLRLLKLPYRVVELCAGDLGFAARRTYDLEVWLPGAGEDGGAWREISSISDCGDFQARRAKIRFRPQGGGRPELVHSLNGSGVAVGRCLAAVLENYHCAEGVEVPEVLRPYMGGLELIPFVSGPA